MEKRDKSARLLWKQFSSTGRIGAYMLYKAYTSQLENQPRS